MNKTNQINQINPFYLFRVAMPCLARVKNPVLYFTGYRTRLIARLKDYRYGPA